MSRGRPFEAGSDPRRNTKGRSSTKLALIRKRIRVLLETESEITNGRTINAIDRIIEKAIQLALRGDDKARRWLFEQGFGKAKIADKEGI